MELEPASPAPPSAFVRRPSGEYAEVFAELRALVARFGGRPVRLAELGGTTSLSRGTRTAPPRHPLHLIHVLQESPPAWTGLQAC
ncbi:MAG: hypothetical protein ABIZ49_01175 [Opitutaceae bacterium]